MTRVRSLDAPCLEDGRRRAVRPQDLVFSASFNPETPLAPEWHGLCFASGVHPGAGRLLMVDDEAAIDVIERSRHLRPETRVVVLTGNGTPDLGAGARRRGADALLHEPLLHLEAVVQSLLPVEP